MKIKITGTEINFIQYICECIAYDNKIDLCKNGIKLSKRISQITNNILMSDDNQVIVDALPFENISSQEISINVKPRHFNLWVNDFFIGNGKDFISKKSYLHYTKTQLEDIHKMIFN